jgi:large subunit ribosomal protein L22
LEARAVEKYIRMSPRKVRLVVDLVKEKTVEDAVDILTFTRRRAATVVRKAIESAVSNALENFKEYKISEEELYIKEIYVTEGPTLKRWRPRARGRADRVMKRTSHLFVVVSDFDSGEVEGPGKVKETKEPRDKNRRKKTGDTEKAVKGKKAVRTKKTAKNKKAGKQDKKEAKV